MLQQADRSRVPPPLPPRKTDHTPRSSNANVSHPPANLDDSRTPSSFSEYSHGPDGDRVSAPTKIDDASRSGSSANPDDPPMASPNVTYPNGPGGNEVTPPTTPRVVDDPSQSGSANEDDPPHPDGPDGTGRKMGAFGTGSRSGATVAGAMMGGLVAGGAGLVAGGAGAVVGGMALRAASGREDGIGRAARNVGAVADVAIEKAQ